MKTLVTCGNLSLGHPLSIFSRIRGTTFALVDLDTEKLEAARQVCGLSQHDLYTDLGKALEERSDADAVVVVTPSALHATFIETALQAGKHVLTVKPFTNSESDA